MIHYKSFSTFYNFIEELIKDNIQFKLIGQSYEGFYGVYFDKKPPNNKCYIKLLALSSIGPFYCSEIINLDEQEKISEIKTKLATLPITNGEISYKDGVVSIK